MYFEIWSLNGPRDGLYFSSSLLFPLNLSSLFHLLYPMCSCSLSCIGNESAYKWNEFKIIDEISYSYLELKCVWINRRLFVRYRHCKVIDDLSFFGIYFGWYLHETLFLMNWLTTTQSLRGRSRFLIHWTCSIRQLTNHTSIGLWFVNEFPLKHEVKVWWPDLNDLIWQWIRINIEPGYKWFLL